MTSEVAERIWLTDGKVLWCKFVEIGSSTQTFSAFQGGSWICKASSVNDALRYTACGPEAGWRWTRRTHESYLEELEADGRQPPILFAKVRGLRLDCVVIDVHHTVDLGVSAHIVGNVFWECVLAHVWGHTTQAANVKMLHDEVAAWYKACKVKHRLQGVLTVERIRTSGDWPKIKAKAAATSILLGSR